MSARRYLSISVLLLALASCSREGKEYAGISFDVQSAPPVPVSIEADRIELTSGIAAKVGAEPISGEKAYSSADVLSLRADDPDILGVYAAEHAREFVFVGLRAGRTCLQVKINRQQEECIDVRVLPTEP